MLTTCPECQLQVSDKAFSCPHCGYPFRTDSVSRTPRKKRLRLPNGFGQISEIKGRNLRKPFRAMVSIGKKENGRPIVKPLKPESYFETYNDAYAALVEFNKNPYDVDAVSITMQELYEKWTEDYFKTVKESAMRLTKLGWKYSSSIHDMRVIDVRVRHLKGCIENEKATPAVKVRMKTMYNLMFDKAIELEIVQNNPARSFDVKKQPKYKTDDAHHSLTDDELDLLWKNINTSEFAAIILIQCYMGWRPTEMRTIELVNVDLNEWTIIGGIKTENGINRTVPIHEKIKDLVKNQYKKALSMGSVYLFPSVQFGVVRQMSYESFRLYYESALFDAGIKTHHTPHDGRKTFVTLAKKYKVDEYAIKRLVGHSIRDLTERVYTDRSIDWLREELAKIK